MKKSLLALAALTAFAGVASAQSSVTLFGIVDLGARSVKNGTNSLKTMSQDGIASSRLGFRGVEDLGGGLRAGFWIEGAIQPDVGTSGGQSWQRRSTISLMGGFGELRLGRDYTPTFWNHTVFDPFGTNGVGSQTNLMAQPAGSTNVLGAGATTLVRANNSVGYFLPAIGGLYGQAMVAHSDGPENGNGYKGLRLGFAGGPVNVAFAVGQTEITNTTDLKAMNLGASFKMGNFTLFGQYHKYEVDSPAAVDPDQTNLLVGGTFAIGAGTLKFSYGKASSDIVANEATQVAVGYVHDLSKRTSVYGTFARIANEAGARYSVSGTGPAFTGSDNKPKSTGYEVGLRHAF